MTPQYRFTFFNTTLAPGGQVVAQPVGWKDASISLTRDPNYHSLVEFFKGSFIWFGSARQFIRDVEDVEGPDAQIRVLIELSFDGSTFQTVFDGTVDVSQIEDIALANRFYKAVVPIVQNDPWVKFLNRVSTPVNLEAAVDLDGNVRDAIAKTVIPMPSQKIRLEFERMHNPALPSALLAPGVSPAYLIFDNSLVTKDEINERFEYGCQISSSLPTDVDKYFFLAEFGGDYQIDIEVNFEISYLSTVPTYDLRWFLAVRQSGVLTVTQMGTTIAGTGNIISAQVTGPRSISTSVTLSAGDEIYVYAKLISSAPGTQINFQPFYFNSGFFTTSFTVVADTNYPDTETDAYLIKDAAESILSKIIGQDEVLVSEKLDSCAGFNAITKGKHIRGYPFSDKIISLSFEDWWFALEPLYNFGLGYKTVGEEKKIIIEGKSFFYNSTPIVFFPNVKNLVRTYDTEKFYKSIEIGTEKWSAESDSGVDDPQTKRVYSTQLKTLGKEKTILSKSILASLAIEQTRRNRVEFGKDWRLDEDNMILALKDDLTLETGADFASVTNVLNSDSRINLRHTPGRMLQRWQEFLAGGLLLPFGSSFKFQKGEGNYEMVSEFDGAQCEEELGELDESADILVGTTATFIPKLYKAKVPMTRNIYDQILANREHALGISESEEDYLSMFILDLDYKLVKGYAELLLILGSETPVNP